uniref:Ankyrin repeat domain-containing protein, chloroplastic n=1 Tax=Anthurium amnicola TaxID=1678845 RepID=A0A1D1ZJA1_9ARAE
MVLWLLPSPAPPPPPAHPSHLLSSAPTARAHLFPARPRGSRRWPFPRALTPSCPASSPGTSRPQLPVRYQYRNPNSSANGEYEKGAAAEESTVGDCLVFEEGAFEGGDPFLPPDPGSRGRGGKRKKPPRRKPVAEANAESLVPDKWKGVVAEINLTKKEKRKIAQELKFGSRVERRKKLPIPDLEEYRSYRAMKLSQLKPLVLDNPRDFPPPPPEEVVAPSGGRVTPRNPRLSVGDGSLELISDFFNSSDYVPGENDDDKKPGKRKLFTKEEKVLLNKSIPNLADATSGKWLPLQTLAASGEFYLLDALLKHNVDINATDKDGLCAIHKALLGNKVAILNYLLRESANPFVRDQDGFTPLDLCLYSGQNSSTYELIKLLKELPKLK